MFDKLEAIENKYEELNIKNSRSCGYFRPGALCKADEGTFGAF